MPPALPWLIAIVAVAAAFNFVLRWRWARMLHERHHDRHSFVHLLKRLGSQRWPPPEWYRRQNADEALMKDLIQIRRWGWLASGVTIVVLYFAFSTVIGHFRQ